MVVPFEKIATALRHLRKADPVMRELISRVGPFTLRLERDRFRILLRSIISQQISIKAARSIRLRVEGLVKPRRPTAEALARLDAVQLRAAGLSPQKIGYVHDLCERVVDGRLRLRRVGWMSDEEVIAELTQVKGIGRWTAQMFLMFSLGRLDVFPHDDLGLRTALRNLYRLGDLPDRSTSEKIAEPWRPYASIATWYCWRSGELSRGDQAYAAGYPV